MAKKKTLPTFDVVGTLDELLPVEMLFVMSGYSNKEESWNRHDFKKAKRITAFGGFKKACYFTNKRSYIAELKNRKSFHKVNLNAIAKYIEDYGK